MVIVSDGATTLGVRDIEPLQKLILALKKSGVRRVDVLTVGAAANPDRLRALVTAGLEEDGAVINGSGSYESIARALTRKTVSNIKVFVKGAKWVWPETLDAMQEGESAVIAVVFDRPVKKVSGRVAGKQFVVDKVAR
ncbi:MAG: hypothetical protein GY822_13005 [Deltaproteobacteria bacterium]|nr:hypothetical protein [Deltaproteobacteria bacterium]